ncbi:MAG: lysine exporter LysO family protein [Desulfurococcales archaeon]|nr:lysine exporter LysO family protein [Desulfurococcales archaeon]
MKLPFSLYTVSVLITGFFLGYHGIDIPSNTMIYTLYLLVLAAGYLIGDELTRLGRNAGKAFATGGFLAFSTILSSIIGGILVSEILGIDTRLGAVIGGGSGWYSLVGPMISQIDPLMGLVGFLANLLREIIHILIYPVLARCCWLPGIAVGGATTMDTGLPVIAMYGGRKASIIAMINGGLITLSVPFVLSFLLGY